MTKHRSMRGEEVDIDLIRMKQELMAGKKTDPTIKREDYVSDRRRRSSSKRINEMLANENLVRQKLEEKKSAATVAPADAPAQVVGTEVKADEQSLAKGRVIKKQEQE